MAAAYLLRPGGSFRRTSPPVEETDNRFADDGSVYLYKEGDGAGYTDAEEDDTMEDRTDERYRMRVQGNDGRGWHENTIVRQRVHGGIEKGREEDDCPVVGMASESGGALASSTAAPTTGTMFGNGGPPASKDFQVERKYSDTVSDEFDVLRQGKSWQKLEGSEDDRQRKNDRGRPRSGSRSRKEADGSRRGKIAEEVGESTEAIQDRQRRESEQPPETLVPVCSNATGKESHSIVAGGETVAPGGGDSAAKLGKMGARLRQMILGRQASTGRSVRQIFGHFDRRGCGYVNAGEIQDALTDLRFDVSPSEAKVNREGAGVFGSTVLHSDL